MGSVIRLARFRTIARRDLPLEIRRGDSDLFPVVLLLWLASLTRVALAFVHRSTFGVEASLAFVCALLLPVLLLRARHSVDIVRR